MTRQVMREKFFSKIASTRLSSQSWARFMIQMRQDIGEMTLTGGLIVISLVVLQDLISSGASDLLLFISLVCLCVAIPILGAGLYIDFLEDQVPPHLRNPPGVMVWAFVVSLVVDPIGIGLAIWHASWVGGLIFLGVSAFVAVICGKYHLELRDKVSEYSKGELQESGSHL